MTCNLLEFLFKKYRILLGMNEALILNLILVRNRLINKVQTMEKRSITTQLKI